MIFRVRALFYFLAVVLLSCTSKAQQVNKSASSQPQTSVSDQGVIADGFYRNSAFGFSYKIPFAWVNRTKEMREDSTTDSSPDSHGSKSILLLAIFERPPEATGDSVNSAVVVAAEPTSSYPGLRNAEQYFDPLTALTKSKGLTVVNEPYEFRLGTMQLVRGDFSKPLGNLTMHQTSLVMIEKGYVVSFTFLGGSEDEVNELVDGLSFGIKTAAAPHK
jgi:hypothetical protein